MFEDIEAGVVVRVTALSYKAPVATSGPQPSDAGVEGDYVWASAEVRTCVDRNDNNLTVSSLPWSLTFADGTTEGDSNITYGNFPKPLFPAGDNSINPGRCVRGNLVFAVPAKTRPKFVTYDTESSVVEWRVPTA